MSISVIVATYGDSSWIDIANDRAYPSLIGQGAASVIFNHDDEGNVASSRNAAAASASGEWILTVDADDQLAPGFIGAMERALEQEGTGGGRLLLTPAVSIVRPGRTPSPPTFFKEVPLRDANWLVVGTLIHKDLFWEVGGFDDYPHGLEDWALWSKCVRVGATVVKVPGAVYRYWANPNSMHRQGFRDKKTHAANHARVAAELDAWEAARA